MTDQNITTLCEAALDILQTPSAQEKANKTRQYARDWHKGHIVELGFKDNIPDRPARPDQPELRRPWDMPKSKKPTSERGKIALLEFYTDWLKVADDEAKHFLMLSDRLVDLNSSYGDLPAHDGLWDSAERTADHFAARLAVVPMVLEARGLDVTPGMIDLMMEQGDTQTADMLKIIHDDEVTHVRAGTVWFKQYCDYYGHDQESYFQELVREYFKADLKKPFNHPSRLEAGMIKDWYEPLAEIKIEEDKKYG